MLKNSAPLFYGLAVMALPLFAVHVAEETNSARAEIAPKVAAARAILEPWLAENPRAGAEESSPRALDADERAAFGTALMGSGNRTYGEQLRGGEQRFLPHARPRLPARGASHVQRLGEGHPFAALGQAGAIGDPAEGKRLRVLRSHHHHVGRTAGASRRTISRHGARRPDMTLDNLVLLKAEPEQGETLA